jgi:hypothetical protein
VPDPEELGRQFLALRVGARLRGVEVTADGRVERRGPDWVLCLSGSEETLRLAPLTSRVQLDTRRNLPQAPGDEERLAWDRLRGEWRSPADAVRVRGPLLRPSREAAPALEVRDFWWFSRARPEACALRLGLDVNGPYGLGEPWAVIREGLLGAGGWEWVAEAPDLETATFNARAASGGWPDQAALGRQLSTLGAGATLRGVEAAVEGRLSRERSRLFLRVRGREEPIHLAPLDRRIEQQGRSRSRTTARIAAERGAHDRLRARAEDGPRLARVFGPVVEARDGLQWLLEVRGFDVEASPGSGLPAPREDRPEEEVHGSVPSSDKEPPAPPASLSVHLHEGRVLLSWAESPEADLDGYNVFRTTTPGKDYIQIAAGIVASRAAFRAGDPGVSYHYAVTARDVSGNESGFSTEAAVRIPGEPSRP